jgi:hypothetical protein
MWSLDVKQAALVACGRRCCICHAFCGTNIECHHIVPESEGGESTLDNCIPLCFDCHANVGHYNPRHPKGTKYSVGELRKHRDTWFSATSEFRLGADVAGQRDPLPSEIYEGQLIELVGFVWREAFPGPPNYESLKTDAKEVYWMLVLRRPLTLVAGSAEDGSSYRIENIKRLQLLLMPRQYESNRGLVLRDARVTGKLRPSITGHHHGDAQCPRSRDGAL